MRQKTLFDVARGVRKFTPRAISNGLKAYDWESAGFFILLVFIIVFNLFDLFQITFLFLGYFWCWALSSREILRKSLSKEYRFSIMRLIKNFNQRYFDLFVQNKIPRKYSRSFSRIASIFSFSLLLALVIKAHFYLMALIGALFFEGLFKIKLILKES